MICEILAKLGYKIENTEIYNKIEEWKAWYEGEVKSFHRYNQFNGKKRIARKRASLSMAKKVCEDWANLLMNEKVESNTNDKKLNKLLKEIFDSNNFRVKSNQLIELTFALGTGAFCENIINGKVNIDYISADMIFPISYDNGTITECAFASKKFVKGKETIYLQLHIKKNGKYAIENYLFDYSSKKEISLPDNIKKVYETGSDIPFFQIITPNIINNFDYTNPMGISVFANSIDTLKSIDLIFDSFLNEFRLGKKRIIIPLGMAHFIAGEDGGVVPAFDDNDTEFYAIKENDSLTEIKEVNMEIRADSHEIGLKRALNMLSVMCGLGGDRYIFENNQAKTATEVISENSELFQNLHKHEIVLKSALVNLIKAVLFLAGKKIDNENIEIMFDDSIIEDKDKEYQRDFQAVSSGIMQKWEFRVKHYGEDEKSAKAKCAEDENYGDEE